MEIASELRKGNILIAERRIRTLTRSGTSRAYAVYLTISSIGARSKGFSQKRPITNAEYMDLINDLWQVVKCPNSYKATPLRRKMLPKPKGGWRPISVPTYLDRALQHLYRLALDIIQEETSDQNSFGFRTYSSPSWAAKDDFIVLCNTEEAVACAFEAAKDFLNPRGLELNLEKSIVRKLPEERFTFVGFKFILETRHGKPKVYNIAPPEKLKAIL